MSRRKGERSRYPVRQFVGSILVLIGAGSVVVSLAVPASAGDVSGWVGLGGGGESDILIDPTLEPQLVPGGAFVEIDQGLVWNLPLPGVSRLGAAQRLSWQSFANDDRRGLLSAALKTDFAAGLGERWRVRGSAGGSYFDDTALETTRRIGAGGDVTLTYLRTGWRGELRGGWQHRWYPNLEAQNDVGAVADYSENTLFIEPSLLISVQRNVLLRISGSADRTDARDPLYDSDAVTGEAAAWWRAGTDWTFSAAGFVRARTFEKRAPGLDSDRYWRAGAGVERLVASELAVWIRYAYARYRDTAGGTDATHRVAAGLTWRFGAQTRGIAPLPSIPPRPAVPRAGEPLSLRLFAPGAGQVALVGDFNAWNPRSRPLRATGDGWWEIELVLPAGVYQYAFWVDGDLVTPPDATSTVPDGFGGRNGVLEIVP